MINALNPVLAVRPKALDGIGMGVSKNIDFVGMWDSIVLVSERWKRFVNKIFIGENMTEKNKPKKKAPKKRNHKYQKKLSLYGMDEKEVLKELLKSPPVPKERRKNIG